MSILHWPRIDQCRSIFQRMDSSKTTDNTILLRRTPSMSTKYYVSSTRRNLLLLYAVALAITCFIGLLTVSAVQANTVPRGAAPVPSGPPVRAQTMQYASLVGEPRFQYVETLGNTLYTENVTWTSDQDLSTCGFDYRGPRRHAHDSTWHNNQGRPRPVNPYRWDLSCPGYRRTAHSIYQQLRYQRYLGRPALYLR